ncbi:MAG: hypothetical protein KGK03_06575 [Candidatus Omnitrophica bacterium]|nr:hypothetical protein [Candidatus Omnitrophota bacterium]MDE2222717.1 hypothetical protein [Candidatus Omnitrophota bacterium]
MKIKVEPSIEKLDWKTSETQTHQFYICEGDHHQEVLDKLVQPIKKYGYVISFQGTPYACLDIGKHLYWTKWGSMDNTIVINRKLIKEK